MMQQISTLSSPRLPWVPLMATLLLGLGMILVGQAAGSRQALLLLVGGALGLTLYHAAFGFTSAWRVFIRDRCDAGLRAQMVMLALAVPLFFPALGAGSLHGWLWLIAAFVGNGLGVQLRPIFFPGERRIARLTGC